MLSQNSEPKQGIKIKTNHRKEFIIQNAKHENELAPFEKTQIENDPIVAWKFLEPHGKISHRITSKKEKIKKEFDSEKQKESFFLRAPPKVKVWL